MMSNGPAMQLDVAKVQARFTEVNGTAGALASALGKSVTYARSVLEGYLPSKGADEIVEALAAYLQVKPKEIVLTKKKSA